MPRFTVTLPRFAAATILTSFCLVALPAAATTATGLRGLVVRGPITPVCAAEAPCTAPAKGVTLSFTRLGVVRSTKTGSDGRYRILLRAGEWKIKISSARFGFKPTTVTVTAGRMAVRNFSIDTGIR